MSSLTVLRDFTISGQSAELNSTGDRLLFGPGVSYPRKLRTAYKSSAGEFFELDSLWFLLENRKIPLSEYVTKASAMGIKAVPFNERRELIRFLTGESDSSTRIDSAALHQLESEEAQKKRKVSHGHATTGDGSAAESSKRARIARPWSGVADIISNEVCLTSRSSILQSSKNFSPFVKVFDRIQSALAHAKDEKTKEIRDAKTGLSGPIGAPSKKSADSAVPIIVVPSGVSSLISLYNVKEFLMNGVYVPSAEKRAMNPKKEECVVLERASSVDRSKNVKYFVIDDVSKLRSGDWDRVCCVFVSGASWQFDDWPKNLFSSPQQIFENVKAFHVHFSDEPLKGNIAQWRTNRLPISKTQRYHDVGIVTEFWDKTIEFISALNNKKKLNI